MSKETVQRLFEFVLLMLMLASVGAGGYAELSGGSNSLEGNRLGWFGSSGFT